MGGRAKPGREAVGHCADRREASVPDREVGLLYAARAACGSLRSDLSVLRVTIEFVEVSARDVAKIPRRNIRVAREDFAAVWRAAEQRNEALGERGESDWFNAGVVVTCRWLATAFVRSELDRGHPARSPITSTTSRAYEELIANECLQAEKLAMRGPVPNWLQGRPGWVEGILATLGWAWQHNDRPPIEVPSEASVNR